MTQRKVNEKMDSRQKRAIPGLATLGKDQYFGTYKWSKDVAGHDGKKQTAPKGSNNDSFGDAPIVGGYTEVDRKKSKGAAGGSVKQLTGIGSKEHKDVHTKSPVRKIKEFAGDPNQQQDPTNPQDPNAQGQQPEDATPPVQQQQAPAPGQTLTTDALLDALPEIVAHAKERKTLDPNYNKKALTSDIAEKLGVEPNDPAIAKIVKFVSTTEKISEGLLGSEPKRSFRDQVHGEEGAGGISPVLGKKPKKHPYAGRLVGEDEDLQNSVDKVTLDVPLLIRVMEYAKEDAKTDMELHKAVERMLEIGGELTMDNYDSIVSNLDEDAVVETIRKVKGGYRLLSSKGKNLGTFDSKAAAEKHEREVQYFKHKGESVESIKEEFNAVKEASAKALKDYKRASAGDAINRQNIANRTGEKDPKIAKRNAGQERAEQKLQAKEKDIKESFAQFKAGKL